ncbi:MAG: hypothetical protein WBK67_04080 [Minisyncoccales bacterium]
MKDITKKYEAQALAITMVALIVSALIGLSIHSRTMKDKMLTMEERASAEALEVSDAVLEKLTLRSINEIVTELVAMDPPAGVSLDDGIVLREGGEGEASELTEFFVILGIIEDGQTLGGLLSPLCPMGVGENEYQLTLKTADEDVYTDYGPGVVWSLPVKNILRDKGDQCFLTMNFDIRGSSKVGFIVSKIYCEYGADGLATECEKYKVDDFDKYCFSSDGDECNAGGRFFDDTATSNWTKFDPDVESVTIPMGNNPPYIAPSEIRITPVGGSIGISYSLSESCGTDEGFRMFQLRATANCGGVYRGKEILIPEAKWHETIFDYVIFNDKGSI